MGKAQRENRAKESHVEAAEGDDEETVSQQNVSEDESNESNNEMETDEDEAFEEESEESAFKKRKKSSSTSLKKSSKGKKAQDAAVRSHSSAGVDLELESSDDDENNAYKAGGVIISVYVEDMNHRKLTVNLNSSLNFITGKNGSGKSAIATRLL